MNKMVSGIYKWTNKITGNAYIGQSINLEKRMKEFLHFNNPIYAGAKINEEREKYNSLKYWIYDILEECPTNKLNEIEQKYIKQHPDAHQLLNITYNKPSLLKDKKTKYPTLNENNFIYLLNQKINQILSDEKLLYYKKNFIKLCSLIHDEHNITNYIPTYLTGKYAEPFLYDMMEININDETFVKHELTYHAYLFCMFQDTKFPYYKTFNWNLKFNEETIDFSDSLYFGYIKDTKSNVNYFEDKPSGKIIINKILFELTKNIACDN